jgi:hypothetical protein
MEATLFISFRISGIGLDINAITDKMGLKPCYTFKKGDVIKDRFSVVHVQNEDCWMFDTEPQASDDLDKIISEFVSKYLTNRAFIRELSEKSNVTVWCEIYPESEQYNIHLSSSVIFLLQDLGVSLDVSMLNLQRFYGGNY